MKKIKISLYFLFVLTLTMSMPMFSALSFENNSKPQWKQFFQRYLTSISIGALVGVSIDVVTEYFLEKITKSHNANKKIEAQILVNLFIVPLMKSVMLKNIRKDMLRDNIPHKDPLMTLTAYFTPFRGFLKKACFSFFQGDACKWLSIFTGTYFRIS